MSDTNLRNLRRQYMLNLLPASAFLAALRRGGASQIWDWMAGNTSFYDLPLRDQAAIFEERWFALVTHNERSSAELWGLEEELEETERIGSEVVWLYGYGAPDAPSVQEVLAERLGSFSYYYGLGTCPAAWISFEDFVITEVDACRRLLAILRRHGCLLPDE
jgi:hypothetical protein